jgi:hypothetical protein
MIWLAPPPTPFHVSKLSLFLRLPVCRRSSLLTEEGMRGGAKSYDGEKAWSFINHLILSDVNDYIHVETASTNDEMSIFKYILLICIVQIKLLKVLLPSYGGNSFGEIIKLLLIVAFLAPVNSNSLYA